MKRHSRAGKGTKERQDYANRIKKLGYNPTVDDSLKFPESDAPSQDLSVSTKLRTRKDPLETRIKEHVSENWVKYFAALIALVISLFMFDFNRDHGKIESDNSHLQEDLSEIKSNNGKLLDKQHSLELKIQENTFRLNSMETKLGEKKSE